MLSIDELHVAVGVIKNPEGNILIAKRPYHLHQGGLWEFPGGKVEPDEDVASALNRELKEELDIEVLESNPLLKVRHAYPDRRVLLDVWQVNAFQGEAVGLENQPILWVKPDDLIQYEFPKANRPIIQAARLPEHYVILDESLGDEAVLFERLLDLANKGFRLIQLRAKKMDERTYLNLTRRMSEVCRSQGMHLLLNADPEWALKSGAGGVHLTSARLMALDKRPLDENHWVAASCHSLPELIKAQQLGCDFAVLSPVLFTQSHPLSEPLGWENFEKLMLHANMPVYALGGMRLEHLAKARQTGAQGIAGIRGF